MNSIIHNIDKSKLPQHIAVIMDGNGRWAKEKGKSRTYGHKNGVISVRQIVEGCAEIGVKYLTLYAFSTENWKRPKFEINTLMTLLVSTIHSETKTLNKNNIRLLTIGDSESLPSKVKSELFKAIEMTSKNTGLTLVLALSYSSKWEIVNAVKCIIKDIESKYINPDSLDESVFANYLSTKDIPDPELLIRTSGENRISNFLLWQMAYTEFFFTPKLWPDFRKDDLFNAIIEYQKRERRFGKTSEQLVMPS